LALRLFIPAARRVGEVLRLGGLHLMGELGMRPIARGHTAGAAGRAAAAAATVAAATAGLGRRV
jgi:hypothetical protein